MGSMDTIEYIDADEVWQQRVADAWGELAARHMHIAGGFSLLALCDGEPVGLIAVEWRTLPPPLRDASEGYIDIIEVRAEFRRRGIATRLVALAVDRARRQGVYQVRAWSSEDKTEAIPMWQALGFGLCPSTTYARGEEVRGYFVTLPLDETIDKDSSHRAGLLS
jgi:GNAT superfamily N-acetyltransferase